MTGPSGFTEDQVLRYSRHIILPEIGGEGQRKLLDAKVLCVGAGGLGSPIADVPGGGRRRHARHPGLRPGRPDQPPAPAAPRHRRRGPSQGGLGGRPSARDEPRTSTWSRTTRCSQSDNAFEIIGQYDIVIDGSDNFPVRYLVNDATQMLGKPLVYGSIYQFEGQASVFMPGQDTPCYRCLFPQPPPPGRCRRAPRAACSACCRDHRLDPGGRGHQADHRNRRPADRPAAAVRRAGHGVHDGEAALGPGLPRVRQAPHGDRSASTTTCSAA